MSAKQDLFRKLPDDVVIVAAKRTPLGKAFKGSFKDLYCEDLLAAALKGTLASVPQLDPNLVQELQVGTVRTPNGGASIARMAALHAGLPVSVSVSTVNKACSSSLAAIWTITNQIRAGDIDIGIAAGVESMTRHTKVGLSQATDGGFSEEVLNGPHSSLCKDCLIPPGQVNEINVVEFGISREAQDAFGAWSQQKADAAQKAGRFESEIVPVTVNGEAVVRDDGIRSGVTAESLASLKPSFGGMTTPGNASQTTDGAAAVILARRSTAQKLGLPVLAKVIKVAASGVPPKFFPIGPAVVIPKLLSSQGLSINDIDIYEINEAFAGQVLACTNQMRLPMDRLNPNGGAIALGHPLGATGARQVATVIAEAKRTGAKLLVTSMCAGMGLGVAGLFVNEQGAAKL